MEIAKLCFDIINNLTCVLPPEGGMPRQMPHPTTSVWSTVERALHIELSKIENVYNKVNNGDYSREEYNIIIDIFNNSLCHYLLLTMDIINDRIEGLDDDDHNDDIAALKTEYNKQIDYLTKIILFIIRNKLFDSTIVNIYGQNILIYACMMIQNENIILELIKSNMFDYQQLDNENKTALSRSCESKLEQVALALIATGQSNPVHVSINTDTALIWACENAMEQTALALIATGQSNPGHINKHGATALIYACENEMEQTTLALIATGQSNHGHIDNEGDTPLIWACQYKMEQTALALIATGQSNPEQVDNEGNTALIWACENKMEQTALALIATGQSNPGHVEDDEASTALQYACANEMEQVALALIATGQSNPGQINALNWTALIYACKYNLEQAALALIATGQSKPEHIINYASGALRFAIENEMWQVCCALHNYVTYNNELIDDLFNKKYNYSYQILKNKQYYYYKCIMYCYNKNNNMNYNVHNLNIIKNIIYNNVKQTQKYTMLFSKIMYHPLNCTDIQNTIMSYLVEDYDFLPEHQHLYNERPFVEVIKDNDQPTTHGPHGPLCACRSDSKRYSRYKSLKQCVKLYGPLL